MSLLAASVVVCCAFAAPGAVAQAKTLYASAEAPPGEPCGESEPCALKAATEKAESGDSIFVEPGEYALAGGGIAIDEDVDVGGPVDDKPVLLTDDQAQVLVTGTKARIHDLVIEGQGPLNLKSGRAERVFVAFDGSWSPDPEAASACKIDVPTGGTTVLRNSVCWAREMGVPTHANAITVSAEGANQDKTVAISNVTAVAAGSVGDGIAALGNSGVRLQIDATNVIARSVNGTDVSARAETGVLSQARVVLQGSSYLTTAVTPQNNSFVEVTAAGTAGNQTEDPQFVDGENGEFQLAATSPALDAGVGIPQIGATDLDGENRVQAKCLGPESKAIPDIGAYERRPTASCPFKAPPPPPPVEPFKAVFRILSLKLNKRTGAGSVQIEVPAAGTAVVTGSGIKFVRRPATGPGTVSLPIRPWVITLVRLNKRGKTKVGLKVKFEPQAGPTQVLARGLLLKRKPR